MRESVVTGAFGAACLASLATGPRPAMFYMGRTFASLRGPSAMAEFERLWDLPAARRSFYVMTLVWGIGLLAEGALRASLALVFPTGTFLVVAPVASWGVTGSLIYFTIIYVKAARRRGPKGPI